MRTMEHCWLQRLGHIFLISLVLVALSSRRGTAQCCPPTLAQKLRSAYTVNPSKNPVFRKCQFYGDPAPNITWELDGHSVPGTVRSKGPYVDASGYLVLRNARPSDSGLYTCIGTNTLGNASTSTHITVEGSESILWQTWWMWFVYAAVLWLILSLCMLVIYFRQARKHNKNQDIEGYTVENQPWTELRDTSIDGPPRHWASMQRDTLTNAPRQVRVVDLQSEQEYQEVEAQFRKTLPSRYNIIKIRRIQNPSLYDEYMVKKKTMRDRNPEGHQNERKLFHGTSKGATRQINHNGFNRSYCGRNATAYGNGTYFARDCSYSASDVYSPKDNDGYKYVYLADVITGVFTRGSSGMKEPPARDPDRNLTFLYDSVVDNPSDPSIFVVFRDAQAYPTHLIVFK